MKDLNKYSTVLEHLKLDELSEPLQRGVLKAKDCLDKCQTDGMKGQLRHYQQRSLSRAIEGIRRDEHDKAKKSTSNETKAYGTILEGMLVDRQYISGVFGREVQARKTGSYDDVLNGVDVVLEFPISTSVGGGERAVALAVDVTFSLPDKIIERKLAKIRHDVFFVPRMADIGTGDKQPEIRDLPRIILGVEIEKIQAMLDLWLKGDYAAMVVNPAKRIFLFEVRSQLKVLWEHAGKMTEHYNGNVPVKTRLESMRRDLKDLNLYLKRIQEIIPDTQNGVDPDRVASQLKRYLPFFSTL